METDKGGIKSIVPCKDCFHFKTVVLQTNNLRYISFSNYKGVNEALRDYGQIQIYYCKKQQLPRVVYVSKRYAYALTSMTCEFRDAA